jgi:hypothetical protein
MAGAVLVLAVAGCSPKAATNGPASSATVSAAAAASTTHNWLYRKGQDYAYQGEASADPRAGSSPVAVQLYRYLGERDGQYQLSFDGETATCANPCQVITISAGLFHVERVDFDPDSLIGSAFTDAFNGQLEVYDPAKKAR